MSKATIILTDVEGAIDANIIFEGGFRADSHAHQHAHLLMKHLGEIARQLSDFTPAASELQAPTAEPSRIALQ